MNLKTIRKYNINHKNYDKLLQSR